MIVLDEWGLSRDWEITVPLHPYTALSTNNRSLRHQAVRWLVGWHQTTHRNILEFDSHRSLQKCRGNHRTSSPALLSQLISCFHGRAQQIIITIGYRWNLMIERRLAKICSRWCKVWIVIHPHSIRDVTSLLWPSWLLMLACAKQLLVVSCLLSLLYGSQLSGEGRHADEWLLEILLLLI